jgi:hypothetical protein
MLMLCWPAEWLQQDLCDVRGAAANSRAAALAVVACKHACMHVRMPMCVHSTRFRMLSSSAVCCRCSAAVCCRVVCVLPWLHPHLARSGQGWGAVQTRRCALYTPQHCTAPQDQSAQWLSLLRGLVCRCLLPLTHHTTSTRFCSSEMFLAVQTDDPPRMLLPVLTRAALSWRMRNCCTCPTCTCTSPPAVNLPPNLLLSAAVAAVWPLPPYTGVLMVCGTLLWWTPGPFCASCIVNVWPPLLSSSPTLSRRLFRPVVFFSAAVAYLP